MPTFARRLAGAVAVSLVVAAVPPAAAADLGRCALLPRPTMRVRLVLRAGVPGDLRDLVERTVAAIWAREHVTLQWLPETDPVPGYAAPDLWLLVTRSLLAGRTGPTPTLGAVQLLDGQPLPRIDVSWAAVRAWMAVERSRAARWLGGPGPVDPSALLPFTELGVRALAYAAAHEIGHFVLATRTHDDQGLMREALDPRVVDAADLRALRLAPSSRGRLRARLAEGVSCLDALLAAR